MENYLVLLLVFICVTYCQEKMSFSSPNLTPEEMHSSHMPENLKCDACSAVVYQVIEFLFYFILYLYFYLN